MTPARSKFHRHWILVLCLAAPGLAFHIPARASQPAPPTFSDAEVATRIDAAVRRRETSVTGYSATEHYAIYRNGDIKPASELTAHVTYTKGIGKDYKITSHSGSEFYRLTVFDKIFAQEKEMSQPAVRETVVVSSANYQMHAEPGTVSRNNRTCVVVDLIPRRKSPHLFKGKAWIDASTFDVVHLEGTPSQPLAFFAGDTTVTRDYSLIDGFPMATHGEAHSHAFLLGNSALIVESSDYQIQQAPKP